MRQAVHDYLLYLASLGRSKRTLSDYRKRLGYFRGSARVKHLREVTIKHVRKYHEDLMQRGLKPSSCWAYMNTIKDFLHWAHDRNLMLSDIASRMELPELGNALPPTPLTEEDIAALFSLVSTSTTAGKRHRAILEVLYGCGLRTQELLGLNVGDIDATAATVFVRGKGDKDRIIPIHETALQAIADYLQARGGRPRKRSPLFVLHKEDEGKRISEATLKHLFRWLRKRFHKHVHPHLLRHTFACHLLQNGADVRYVQALLGHSSPDTTSRYLGLVKEDLMRAYDAAMERILS